MRHPSTPADRVPWTGELLARERRYGTVAAVARASGASRPTLRAWRATGRAALERAFTPAPTALAAPTVSLPRAVLTLLFEGHASYRGVQTCLRELLGRHVSLGAITKLVRQAGERALGWFATHAPAAPVALALDECFGGTRDAAYLSAVAVPSGAVWAAVGPVAPDAASWRLVLRDVQTHGIRWHTAVHDGGHAAAAASAAVAPDAVLVRDVWHVLARCAEVQGRLDRAVTVAWDRWLTVATYEEATAAGRRPKGRVPTTTAAAQEARVGAAERVAADVAYLTGAVHRLVDVVVERRGRLLAAADRRTELAAALALLAEVAAAAPVPQRSEIAALRAHLATALDGLLAWVPDLDAVQRDLATVLGDDGVALVGWAWRHRDEVGWTADELIAALPAAWRPAARVLVTAWEHTARASSVVEGWHAAVRPHLALRRRLSDRFLALLALRHNHRVATAGRHAGTSPLHRGGVADVPTDWLTVLGYPPTAAVRPPVLAAEEAPMAA